MGVKVWKVHLDRPDDSRWWRMLSDAERERASQLACPVRRRRFTVAHAALRAVLGRMCGVRPARLEFRTEAAGRPYLVPVDGRPPPDFNLSHSGAWALIAVAPAPWRVGVDVERVRPNLDWLGMARTMYQPAEVDRLEHADPDGCRAEYFRLWCAKEAYVKAVGVGLAGLRDVLVSPEDRTVSSRSAPDSVWPVRWLDIAPGYAAALVRMAHEVVRL